MSSTFSVTNLARHTPVPRFPYTRIAASVLPGWEISLVFVSALRARSLNERLRGKTYTPNVLSYAVGKKNGEIFICRDAADSEASAYGMSERIFVLYLFIHGLLHLKGEAHSGTMEQRERKLLAKYTKSGVSARTHAPTHSNRNRHRHVSGEAGRRRGTRR